MRQMIDEAVLLSWPRLLNNDCYFSNLSEEDNGGLSVSVTIQETSQRKFVKFAIP